MLGEFIRVWTVLGGTLESPDSTGKESGKAVLGGEAGLVVKAGPRV